MAPSRPAAASSRTLAAAYYGAPMLLCLAIHFRALKTWFANDDFAWLSLRQQIGSWHDLGAVLFAPMAQGTVRLFSERLYFIVFSSLFGLHALPFRIWVFLTQFASVALLAWIARRLTGSRAAGFLAPIFWSANAALALAMGWSSAYNEILFAFFVLLAFFLFLKHVDTGRRGYWIAQWAVFILGFGALELMVTYPALACAYALCCARKHFRKTLFLFIPSALFTLAHFALIPKPREGPYQMFFDRDVLATLWRYWGLAVAAVRASDVTGRMPFRWELFAITAALLAFAIWKIARRERLAAFALAWFFIALAPVLPLKNHFTDYYLTVPVIGLAILAGWGAAAAMHARAAPALARVTVLALAAIYARRSIADIRAADRFQYNRARELRQLMEGLAGDAKKIAGKTVLLDGVDNDLYWAGFWDDPFKLIGLREIYLTPGSERAIESHPEWGGIARFELPLEKVAQALAKRRGVVYRVGQGRIRDITAGYKAQAAAALRAAGIQYVDVTDPDAAGKLGPGWYAIEDGFRWMSQTAAVHFEGPKSPSQRLYLAGFCPGVVLAAGPLELSAFAGGVKLGAARIAQPDQAFEMSFPLPASIAGTRALEVSIELNRALRVPTDPRVFGVTFGTFTIK